MNKRTGARANVRAGGTLAGNSNRPRQPAAAARRPEAPRSPDHDAATAAERASPKAGATQAATPFRAIAPPTQPTVVSRPATKFGRPGRASDVHGAAPARGLTSAHGKEAAARLFGDYSYVKQDLVRIAILTVAALLCLVAISFLLPLWLH